MSFLKRVIKIVLLISIFLFVFSYFKKNDLPPQELIINSLYNEPKQGKTEIKSFEINKKEFVYKINPQYSYELYGLVVSQYDSENWIDFYHKKDPLNTKDVCVVWGDNIKNGVYQQMEYGHGEFTCYWNLKSGADRSWHQKFSIYQGSNSHLLPKDDEIYKIIKKAKIGDQIYFKGYLVSYSVVSPEGGVSGIRNTSVTRMDAGNGACEVVYVNDFKILREGNSSFVLINNIAKSSMIICLFLLAVIFIYEIFFYKGHSYIIKNIE